MDRIYFPDRVWAVLARGLALLSGPGNKRTPFFSRTAQMQDSQGGVWQGRCECRPGFASTLSCCKTRTIVTPTSKKLQRNCILLIFVVKHNEYAAFSVQDALVAPMAAPAPREFPRELPESLRKPPRCSQMLQRAKKTLFGFSR